MQKILTECTHIVPTKQADFETVVCFLTFYDDFLLGATLELYQALGGRKVPFHPPRILTQPAWVGGKAPWAGGEASWVGGKYLSTRPGISSPSFCFELG